MRRNTIIIELTKKLFCIVLRIGNDDSHPTMRGGFGFVGEINLKQSVVLWQFA